MIKVKWQKVKADKSQNKKVKQKSKQIEIEVAKVRSFLRLKCRKEVQCK